MTFGGTEAAIIPDLSNSSMADRNCGTPSSINRSHLKRYWLLSQYQVIIYYYKILDELIG